MKKILYLLLFTAVFSFAQTGDNDPTFNPTDIGFGNGDGASNGVYITAVQSDGKIIIGGVFNSYNGTARNRIARLNADGSLDATFNPGTGANGPVYTTAVQSDGKIIIGGDFSTYNGTARNRIARLSADGSLDATFNPGTGASNFVYTTAVQSDGKIIIGGDFFTYNGTARNYIARLNADGSLDATFNPGTGADNRVYTTALQSDGKIIIGGNFTTYNGTARNRIARLNTDGSLDGSFNPGTGTDNSVWTTAVQSDGKIIIGGAFTTYNGTARNRIARLNTDGSLDATFNPGTGADDWVYTTAVQSDGKIIIGGEFITYNGTARNRIARLNADGSLDAIFNPGTGANDIVRTTALQSDGKIIIGGFFITYNGTARNRIARLNTDGSLDATFNPGTGANSYVETTAVQSDGKVIIGGDFTTYNGTAINCIARLNADGSLDASFNPGTGANHRVATTALQSDGKIIIGGGFSSYNGTARNCIARLNTDGSLDASFNPGTGANGIVLTTALQSDGKIIIGGAFTTYNGTGRNRIARLNADGSLDATFNPGTGADDWVYTTALQSDGKIIIGGDFTSYNGTGRNRVARLNADGSLDATFNPGTGANGLVRTTAVQSDGKIIIGGEFITYNGTARNYIARLNANGSLDASFNPGTGANSTIWTTTLQSDGKIVIGGEFITYNGTVRNRIARLNADGSLDATFNPGTGTNNIVRTTAVQSDGKIIIGGQFTSYNGTGRNRIARILNCTTPNVTLTGTNIICSGSNTTFTASGGTSYLWSNGATTAAITVSVANTYAVTITDANSCTATSSRILTVNNSPTLSITAVDAICSAANGSLTATANDGTAPFAYNWSNGQSSSIVTGLIAGTYSLTITDANGCESTASAVVNSLTSNLSLTANSTQELCTSSNGTATASTTGGTAPFSYVWNNGATDATISGLSAGSYSLTVTDANGCEAIASATVGSSAGNISATVVSTDVTSNGGTDGTADITITGATAPVSYLWSNGATTEDVNGLAAGTYSLTITDANGCEFIQNININQPPVSITASANNLSVNLYPNPAENQTMVAVELGTVSNVRIRLINSLGQVIQSVEYSDVMSVQHHLNVSDLPAAMYMVEITAGGIQKVQQLIITRK
jgi:uncharacterized delta-60 repeat protein